MQSEDNLWMAVGTKVRNIAKQQGVYDARLNRTLQS